MTHAKIIREMQESDQVVHVIGSRQADDLVAAGLVRRATIDPPPAQNKAAVNLTVLGKSWDGKAPLTSPEQAPAAEQTGEEK